jgi:hypothetical protein
MIIYAPIINPSIPAFAGNELKIYFDHNIAVDEYSVSKIKAIIKQYNNSQEVETLSSDPDSLNLTEGIVTFTVDDTKYTTGAFYKI